MGIWEVHVDLSQGLVIIVESLYRVISISPFTAKTIKSVTKKRETRHFGTSPNHTIYIP